MDARLEEVLADVGRNAAAVVRDFDFDRPVVGGRGDGDGELRRGLWTTAFSRTFRNTSPTPAEAIEERTESIEQLLDTANVVLESETEGGSSNASISGASSGRRSP